MPRPKKQADTNSVKTTPVEVVLEVGTANNITGSANEFQLETAGKAVTAPGYAELLNDPF